MPFTPYHMGPGLLIKSLLRGSFSLMVFGWTQMIMDIQPLVGLITHHGKLHGFSHTYLGATLIGAFSAITGKYFSQIALAAVLEKRWREIEILWSVAIVSAFVGSYSHVIIDSVVHGDMQPLYPFAGNGLLGLLSGRSVDRLCLYGGLLGAVLYFLVQVVIARRTAAIKAIGETPTTASPLGENADD